MIPECATASCQGIMRGGKSVFAASDIQVTMKAVALTDAKNQKIKDVRLISRTQEEKIHQEKYKSHIFVHLCNVFISRKGVCELEQLEGGTGLRPWQQQGSAHHLRLVQMCWCSRGYRGSGISTDPEMHTASAQKFISINYWQIHLKSQAPAPRLKIVTELQRGNRHDLFLR